MTSEKAIQLLHRLQDEQFGGEYGDERREALEMAVRALEGDGDTIYRKAAIDAIEEMQMSIMRSDFSGDQFIFTGMSRALQVIKDLPSAQPHWIPCSERLPELYEDVLITDSDGIVDIASMDEYWDGDETKRKWYLSNYGFINVLAWMPLPKPYGGVDE